MSAVGEMISGVAKGIFNVFLTGVPLLITKVLSAMGLTVLSLNTILPTAKNFVQNYIVQLPPKLLELAAAVGIDVAVSMVISAAVVKVSFKVFIVPTSVADQLRGGAP